MNSLRQRLGMDLVDLLIHLGVTGALLGFVAISGAPTEVLPLVLGASFLVLGVRRYLGLRAPGRPGLTSGEMAAERIAELEQRMENLEVAQARVAELEERLDFAERLLARGPAREQQVLSAGDAPASVGVGRPR